MDTKKLRQKILDLAIHGRLVPQDPADEPASALLKRIRAEKKLKNKKFGFTPIKDDEYNCRIPKGWNLARYADFVTFTGGAQPSKEYFEYEKNSENIRLIQIRDYKSDKFITYIPKDKARRFCTKDDVMIGRYGPPLFQILRGIEGSYNVALIKAEVDPLLMSKDYLYYLLQDNKLLKLLESLSDRTCGQDGVNIVELNRYVVGIPPLAEQQRIVAKVEELFAQIDIIEQSETALEEAKAKAHSKILDLAIHGKLVPQDPNDEPASELLKRIRAEKQQMVKDGKLKKKDLDVKPITADEIPFEIPESWEWVRMEEVFQFINGRAYKREELLAAGKYKVLRVGNFFTNDSWYYSDLELEDEKYCTNGDLLYAWSASFGPQIWNGEKTIFHYHIWNIKYSFENLYREYLYYFLLDDVQRIKQNTTGSTMIHVSMENMKPRLIPLPPLAEQKRIVAKIEELFELLK